MSRAYAAGRTVRKWVGWVLVLVITGVLLYVLYVSIQAWVVDAKQERARDPLEQAWSDIGNDSQIRTVDVEGTMCVVVAKNRASAAVAVDCRWPVISSTSQP